MKYRINLVANGEYDKEIEVEGEKMNAVMAELRATMDGAVQKRFLSELTEEELKRVLEVNKKLVQMIDESIAEDDMFFQQEEFENLNIKDSVNVIDYYSSFYLRCKDAIKLVEDIDVEYASIETLEQFKTAKKAYDKYMETQADEDLEVLEEECDFLVDRITEQLRAYEDHDFSLENELEYMQNCMSLDNYYILSDTYVVYEDITKSYQ